MNPSTRRCWRRSSGRGASFWPELVAAVAAAGPAVRRRPRCSPRCGTSCGPAMVTNDSLAPLRALVSGRGRKARVRRRGGAALGGRPGPGALTAARPAGRRRPVVAGRAAAASRRPSPTEAAHARAIQLLERYGVLTREAALGEGIEGGFAGVYPVLRRSRSGAGCGGATSSPASAPPSSPCPAPSTGSARSAATSRVERRREPGGAGRHRPGPALRRRAAVARAPDGRPSRAAGAHVVLVDGRPVAYLERGGHSLVTFPAPPNGPTGRPRLRRLADRGRYRSIEIRTADGVPVRETPVADALRAAGFVEGYRGLVYHPRRSPGNRPR